MKARSGLGLVHCKPRTAFSLNRTSRGLQGQPGAATAHCFWLPILPTPERVPLPGRLWAPGLWAATCHGTQWVAVSLQPMGFFP